MIPSAAGFLNRDFRIREQPGLTYRLHTEDQLVRGYTDGLDAVRQAVYKILMTERYEYVMYSWNYGIQLSGLLGKPVTYVCPELKRRISEALLMDDRISSVDQFEFDFPEKGVVHVMFTVHTIFGDMQAERKVNV
ncbi:MAG: DUF2634 domain-containing protein [Hungatella sp.]|nr:DUF2634 domain-containing protein [Hungatella sp.]